MEHESQAAELPRLRFQFSVRSLIWLTVLVALFFAISLNQWLGPPYGLLTAIPVGVIGSLAVCTRGWSLIGSALGFPTLCLIGYWLILGDALPYAAFVKAMVVIGSYGAAVGGSIHAILLRHRIVGGLCLTATSIVFVTILVFPPSVRVDRPDSPTSPANKARPQVGPVSP
jgi:hypothetical protein